MEGKRYARRSHVVSESFGRSDKWIKQKKAVCHQQLQMHFSGLLPALQDRCTDLRDVNKVKVLEARSGRSIAEQGSKGLALCTN